MTQTNARGVPDGAPADTELKFRTVLEAAIDAIVIGDAVGNIIAWNSSAENVFGYTEAEALGKPLTMLMPERYREAHLNGLTRLYQTGQRQLVGTTSELQAIRKNGEEFPIEISLGTWVTAEGRFFCGIIRDITERKAFEAALRHAALHDALSQLPNRLFLTNALRETAESARKAGSSTAVLAVDLDNFKTVNDTYGHHIGDLLIRAAGQRLQDTVRPTDVVARVGGDEFVVLLEGLRTPSDAQIVAARIVTALARPFALEAVLVTISASVGIGLRHGDFVPGELLQDADKALYRAKDEGKATYHPHQP